MLYIHERGLLKQFDFLKCFIRKEALNAVKPVCVHKTEANRWMRCVI